jgi:hypothetical protein
VKRFTGLSYLRSHYFSVTRPKSCRGLLGGHRGRVAGLPLHNNPAELGARTMLLRRNISYGTRTLEGTKAIALSVKS